MVNHYKVMNLECLVVDVEWYIEAGSMIAIQLPLLIEITVFNKSCSNSKVGIDNVRGVGGSSKEHGSLAMYAWLLIPGEHHQAWLNVLWDVVVHQSGIEQVLALVHLRELLVIVEA